MAKRTITLPKKENNPSIRDQVQKGIQRIDPLSDQIKEANERKLALRHEKFKHLEKIKPTLTDLVKTFIDPERFFASLLQALALNQTLLTCTVESLGLGAMQAAEMGLNCSGATGEGWLIPFYNSKKQLTEAKFIPGYKGLISIALRSKKIAWMDAKVVYDLKDEIFLYEYGTAMNLKHVPDLNRPNDAPIKAAYSIAQSTDTRQIIFHIMGIQDMNRIKNGSAGKTNNIWVDHKSEMYKKMPIRQHCKMLALSPLLNYATAIDDCVANGTQMPALTREGQEAMNRLGISPEFETDYSSKEVSLPSPDFSADPQLAEIIEGDVTEFLQATGAK